MNARTPAGPVCGTCYQQPLDTCDRCGEPGVILSRKGAEALCRRCYQNPKALCTGCGRTRRVAIRLPEGGQLCPTCHQAPILTCATCGTTTRCRTTTPDHSPICYRCQLQTRVDALLSDHTGQVPDTLHTFRNVLLSVDNPLTGIGWLARSPAIGVLTLMCQGQRPFTHATLDDAAATYPKYPWAIEHLRHLLVASAVLPRRDEPVARLETWARAAIAAAHPDDQQLLNAYTRWMVLPAARRAAGKGKQTRHIGYSRRDRVATAIGYLAWLRGAEVDPSHATQADVDHWLEQHPRRARQQLKPFLTWSRKRQALPAFTLPTAPPNPQPEVTPFEQRWSLARQALNDTSWQTRDRVAVALVTLYGQTPEHIVRLRREHLTPTATGADLRLGPQAVSLLQPLADLILKLPEHPPVGMAAALTHDDWLFPGRHPNKPMTSTQLSHRLNQLGVAPRQARNSALLDLAEHLAAPVIADTLGITIATAEHWRALAGARWLNYTAQHQPAHTPDQPPPGTAFDRSE